MSPADLGTRWEVFKVFQKFSLLRWTEREMSQICGKMVMEDTANFPEWTFLILSPPPYLNRKMLLKLEWSERHNCNRNAH